ncbi:MAG: acyl-CoA dehydrogenase family protein [Promethearchaeota archaeon]
MYDFLCDEKTLEWKKRAKEFAKKVPRKLIIDMDQEKVQYPKEFVQMAAEHKLLGCRFSSKYGGGDGNWVIETAVNEEIGVISTALSCLFVLPSICGEAIYRFGTEEQKQKYLKPTLEGKKFTAEALTEPRGGSDFFGATTTAKKEGDQYILNGQKRFVVGAEGADYFLVYAKTNPKAPPHESISLFIVDRKDGVETEYLYGLLGTRGGGAGRLVFRDVQVPEENLIGGEGMGGKIFYQMMIPERMTSATGVLGLQPAIDLVAKYASKRKAFGKPIRSFQGVNFRIADSLMLLDAMRGLCYMTALALDQNNGLTNSFVRRLVSETKRFCTENAYKILDNCMQVLGGIGYTNVFPIEKLLRDIRLSSIWTGTSEIMNLIIQHEYFKELEKKKEEHRDISLDAKEADAKDEIVYE